MVMTAEKCITYIFVTMDQLFSYVLNYCILIRRQNENRYINNVLKIQTISYDIETIAIAIRRNAFDGRFL